MRRTKVLALATAKATPAPSQAGPERARPPLRPGLLQRAPAGPAPKPAPAVGREEVNQTPDFAAAGVAPPGRPLAAGRVDLVGPGAAYTPPPGMELKCFLHRDGSAVKFAGTAGAVYLDRGEVEQEFGPLAAQARALLAAHPAPGKAAAPKPAKPATVSRAAETTAQPEADSTAVHTALTASAGRPLPSAARSKLESSFDADLGQVRVHTDTAADQAARFVHAHTFTTGQDVFFRSGQYRPDAADGQKLLAHEVAHTVQQAGGLARQADPSELHVSEPGDPLEKEAETAADQTTRGQSAELHPRSGAAPLARLATESTLAPPPAAPRMAGPGVIPSANNAPSAKAPPPPSVKKDQAAEAPPPEGPKTKAKEPPAKPEAEKPAQDKAAPGKAATEKPEAEKSAAGKATGEKSAAGAEEKPAAKGEPKKGEKGETKAGPAAEGAEKAEGGPEEAGPAPDAGLQAVVGQVKGAAGKQKVHPLAEAKAAEAAAAAQGPPNEVAALAAGQQVGTMDQQEAKPFDRAKFLETLLSRIDAVAPQTLEEADEFKEKGKVGELKGGLTQEVGQHKEAAQGNVAAAAKAEPSTAGIEPKQAAELPAAPPVPASDVAAAKATPPPVPEQAVSLAGESQKLDDQMASADVTREQLEKSNEPSFQKAVADKDAAQAQAAQAPKDYRTAEQATLAGAKADNQAAVSKQLAAMAGTRDKAMGQVLTGQTAAKGADEAKRAEVTKGIQAIYDQAKKDVDDRLTKLDADVNAAFDTAAQKAQQVFEDHVADRMSAFKDKRYSGPLGGGRWLKDKLLGLPPEVNAFYVEGKQKYIAAMRTAMEGIATLVEQGITDAKAKIAAGKKKVDEYVNGQPKELQDIARQAADGFKDKFDQLEQGVDDKQNQIVDGLVSRYQEKLKELDDRIAAMKAENGGLLDAVMAAVGGVIQTILELKAMLLGVLAKAQDAIGLIIKDPIGFLGNLVAGVKLGVQNFVARIGKHLKDGFFEWLFGTLAAAGIQMPKQFDLKGVLGLVLQILGLTYANFRSRAVKIVGEKVVSAIETASEMLCRKP